MTSVTTLSLLTKGSSRVIDIPFTANTGVNNTHHAFAKASVVDSAPSHPVI